MPNTVKSVNYTVKKTSKLILVQNDPQAILMVMNHPVMLGSHVKMTLVSDATNNNLFEVPNTVKSVNYTVKKTNKLILVQNDP